MIISEIECCKVYLRKLSYEVRKSIEGHHFLVRIDIRSISRSFEIAYDKVRWIKKRADIFPYPPSSAWFLCMSCNIAGEHDISYHEEIYGFFCRLGCWRGSGWFVCFWQGSWTQKKSDIPCYEKTRKQESYDKEYSTIKSTKHRRNSIGFLYFSSVFFVYLILCVFSSIIYSCWNIVILNQPIIQKFLSIK